MINRLLLKVTTVACLLTAAIGCNSQPHSDPGSHPATSRVPTSQEAIARIEQDLYYLASDSLEGRGVGTRGLDMAADFIAARFDELGLKPLPGQEQYFQRFSMTASTAVGPKSALAAGERSFKVGEQITPLGFSAAGDFSGPVVFAGYGIASAEHHYDDYAGIDVKGKVVLVLRYEPHNEKGTSRFMEGDWSPDAALNSKAEAAKAHGAAAILLVNPPKFHGKDRLIPVSRGGPRSEIPYLQVKQEVADELLKRGGAGQTLEQLQTEIDTSGQPHSLALKDVIVSGTADLERRKVPVENVMACLRGSGKPDEYIVVGAHYDHLGHGGTGSLSRRGGDEIHYGADDNASGTTAVLSLAERMVRQGQRPQRSVLFVLFTGEEEGLIGSQYFVEHPPVKLEQIVAMINMDMVGRIRHETLYMGGSGTAAAFDQIIKAADEASPLQVKSIGKGGWGPSDHMVFAQKKVPVLFLFSGMHSDYHTPTDRPEKINYAGEEEVVEFAGHLVKGLAAMPRQQYVSTFDSQRLAIGSMSRGGAGVTLGVVPDYGTDESTEGVRITGTSPGSPAEKAGLRDGDVIVRINGRKITNLYDLTEFLGKSRPGEAVKVIAERDGRPVELDAVLAERKND